MSCDVMLQVWGVSLPGAMELVDSWLIMNSREGKTSKIVHVTS